MYVLCIQYTHIYIYIIDLYIYTYVYMGLCESRVFHIPMAIFGYPYFQTNLYIYQHIIEHYIYIYICGSIYMWRHQDKFTYVYICDHTRTNINAHILTYMNIHVKYHLYTCINLYTNVCIGPYTTMQYTQIHIDLQKYANTHTHTHTQCICMCKLSWSRGTPWTPIQAPWSFWCLPRCGTLYPHHRGPQI